MTQQFLQSLENKDQSASEWMLTLSQIDPIAIQEYYDTHRIERVVIQDRRGWEAPVGKLSYKKTPIPSDFRWAVFERDNFTCLECGSRRDLTVDHILAESKGGPLTMENARTLCRSCNSRKGAK
jgi:5-methylcytosine-specific restriction endonuclease McrA